MAISAFVLIRVCRVYRVITIIRVIRMTRIIRVISVTRIIRVIGTMKVFRVLRISWVILSFLGVLWLFFWFVALLFL